jgi:hypothetical protein
MVSIENTQLDMGTHEPYKLPAQNLYFSALKILK